MNEKRKNIDGVGSRKSSKIEIRAHDRRNSESRDIQDILIKRMEIDFQISSNSYDDIQQFTNIQERLPNIASRKKDSLYQPSQKK